MKIEIEKLKGACEMAEGAAWAAGVACKFKSQRKNDGGWQMNPMGTNSDHQYNRSTRSWKCPKCGNDGAEDVYICRFCDREIDLPDCIDCSEVARKFPRCDACGAVDRNAPQN